MFLFIINNIITYYKSVIENKMPFRPLTSSSSLFPPFFHFLNSLSFSSSLLTPPQQSSCQFVYFPHLFSIYLKMVPFHFSVSLFITLLLKKTLSTNQYSFPLTLQSTIYKYLSSTSSLLVFRRQQTVREKWPIFRILIWVKRRNYNQFSLLFFTSSISCYVRKKQLIIKLNFNSVPISIDFVFPLTIGFARLFYQSFSFTYCG